MVAGGASVVRTLLRGSLVLFILYEHRNGRAFSRRISILAAAEGALEVEGAGAEAAMERYREPFVDDGMFDPRRDYWGEYNKTVGSQSTPASLNWAIGEILGPFNCHGPRMNEE